MSLPHPTSANVEFHDLLVACLCAQWCGTCTQYRPLFTALQTEFPGARFAWIDVEDEAELVDPIEVENFPTLMIAVGSEARFFGTVTPHLETLRRLIHSGADSAAGQCPDPDVQELAKRLTASLTPRPAR
jgi:thioredoxin 1